MKTVCAWCRKVIFEGPEITHSHGICEECEKRVAKDSADPDGHHPTKGHTRRKPFKPPPVEEFRDWTTFIDGQLLMGFTMFIIIFLVVMAAEGLHYLTGGKVPELIEWHPEKPEPRLFN